MSRIGRKPIPVPSTVKITATPEHILVSGPKGEMSQVLPALITISQENGTLEVQRGSEEPNVRALHGLIRSLLANMITGVTSGFTKTLVIQGVGYRATKEGSDLRLAVGYSHPVIIPAPAGIDFNVPLPTRVEVSGISKELVGEVAAKVRSKRPPEPYLGKGIRYENEIVRRKAGKTGKAGGK
jgi:large subunit ribosomal protein L6